MTGWFVGMLALGVGWSQAPMEAGPEPLDGGDERPLAIPVDAVPSPARPPALTRPRASAPSLREYRSNALRLGTATAVTQVTTYSNYGWWGPTLGGTSVVQTRTEPQLWRGNELLDNLGYLQAVGRITDLRLLEQRLDTYARTRRIGDGVGIGGALTVIVGFVAAGQARTNVALQDANWVIGGGVAALVTGALVGATANRRATAARYSLDEVGTRERLNAEIGEHNEDLRVRLGLTETEALDAEYPSP